jgi:hypothetical protein
MNHLGIDTRTQMLFVKQRHAELIHEAEQYLLARAHANQSVDHLSSRLFHSMRASLEPPFASVQRAFSGVEAPCDEPCTDCPIPC